MAISLDRKDRVRSEVFCDGDGLVGSDRFGIRMVKFHRTSGLLQRANSPCHHVPLGATQEKRTIVVRVVFKHRHDINKALERFEYEYRCNFWRLCCQHLAIAVEARTGMFLNWSRVDDSHGALNDCPPSQRACPFLEDGIPLNRILQSGDKALLSFLLTRSQQKRQTVQAVRLFVEDSAEITAVRVLCAGVVMCFASRMFTSVRFLLFHEINSHDLFTCL